MFPEDDSKEYTVELLKKLDHREENNIAIVPNNFAFSYLWDSLNHKARKEMIGKFISSLEISLDNNFNIEITNIKNLVMNS